MDLKSNEINPYLKVSSIYLNSMLHDMSTDIIDINKRIDLIKYTRKFKTIYPDFLNFDIKYIYNIKDRLITNIGFDWNFLNKSLLLDIRYMYFVITPIYRLVMPLLYIIIPYIILYTKHKTNFSFFRNVVCQIAFDTFLKTNIVQKLSCIGSFLIWIQSIVQGYHVSKKTYEQHRILDSTMFEYEMITTELDKFDKDTTEFENAIFKELNYAKNVDKSMDDSGNNIKYLNFEYNKALQYIRKYYAIEAAFEICDLLNTGFCIPNFIESTKPIIHSIQMGLPSNLKHKRYDVTLKGHNLVTGPNAGGKSTFMKSVANNVILAQTIGVVCAEKFICTKFDFVQTHFAIKDTVKRSLFQCEIDRIQHVIEICETNKNALILIDEIFSGTNPQEGKQAAQICCKMIGDYKNTLTIISTHFTDIKFKGCKLCFPVKIVSNRIEFMYKLCKGVCKQMIAIHMLKDSKIKDFLIKYPDTMTIS